ncbi:hypothetical protein CWR43_01650 [Rhizobium sullae]|uniref:Uncharacterized protein n=1 Tax=Rhizobium sullae TaxID=50338 RepID=A0A2N0DER8_RHISU|nr:hypothetical protein CWR43_01650 [Rhizobium sullae]
MPFTETKYRHWTHNESSGRVMCALTGVVNELRFSHRQRLHEQPRPLAHLAAQASLGRMVENVERDQSVKPLLMLHFAP